MVQRPWGIGFISTLGMFGSLVTVLVGIFGAVLLGILLGPIGALLGTFLGVVCVVVGAVNFIINYGLWKMKRWAWIAETILLTLGILVGITNTIITRGLGNILSIVIGAIILYYLYSKRTLFSSEMPMQKEEYAYQKPQEVPIKQPTKLFKKLAILTIVIVVLLVSALLVLSYLGGTPKPITIQSKLGSFSLDFYNNKNSSITVKYANATIDGNEVGWNFLNDSIPSDVIINPHSNEFLNAIVTSGNWVNPSSYPVDLKIYYIYDGEMLSSSLEINNQSYFTQVSSNPASASNSSFQSQSTTPSSQSSTPATNSTGLFIDGGAQVWESGINPFGLRIGLVNNESGSVTLISANATVNGSNVGWSFVTQGVSNTSGYLTLNPSPAGTGILEEAALTSGTWVEPSAYPVDFEVYYTYNGQTLSSSGEITGQA